MCFFFQAEDGIRDTSVTGVQTCALPISPSGRREAHPCGSSHASSFPQLPFRGSRSVLRATLLRRVRFGTAIGVRSLFFVARTQPLLMTPPRFWQSLPPVAPILGFRY